MEYKPERSFLMDYNDMPSAAKFFAAMLEGKGSSKFTTMSKLISARLPVGLLGAIDAFAETTGSNRNKVIVHLLEAGIEAVLDQIEDKETKEKLKHLQAVKIGDLIPEAKEEPIYDSENE